MAVAASGSATAPTRGDAFSPAWSPDGRLIAFSSSVWTPENPEIYVVRPDGTGRRRLTKTKGSVDVLGDDGWPSWAPGGKRIAFSATAPVTARSGS